MKRRLFGIGLATTLSIFGGCATTQLQTNAKMTQSIFINPVAKEQRSIFVATKNSSGQEINLEEKITQKLLAKGYHLVEDPVKAKYILMVNILYCDKKRENNTAGAGTLGGIVGGVANSGSNSGKSVAGAAIAGAVIGGVLGKLTEDTIYQMQVDVLIRERSDTKVQTSKGSAGGQSSVDDVKKAGFLNSFGGSIKNTETSGQLRSNSSDQTTQSFEVDYIEHKTAVFAEATKMGLEMSEATPLLEEKISAQVVGLF